MDRATVERRPKPSLARLGHAARRFAAIGRLGVGSIRGSFYAGAAAALVLVCAAQGWPGAAHAQTNDAPQIDSTGPFAVVEGSTMVATLSATDPDTASDLLVWSIPTGLAGGADADKFTLSSSGVLTFEAGKDYESPDDADADGTYGVVVQVSDGVDTDTADLEVTLENAIELLSEVLGPAAVSFEEGRWVRVAAYSASSDEDRDGVEWSLSGDDRGDFAIDGGVLRFAATPDYEEPSDADDDNDYSVTVTARVGGDSLPIWMWLWL